ncbi:CHCH domain protein [Metarhizium acridum CQMa 102]|uniref:CHCH domain protein n=1 Tax=Metarhizium acridum (strain CQMa 102) TaxID=655827 RepID=E9ECI9_METAQ|nr:CHCH domain protein [Metarhizium acridum CQMa 102]EFY86366.1 CHCH domain protein [Metarhizium acridum CQMa 102]
MTTWTPATSPEATRPTPANPPPPIGHVHQPPQNIANSSPSFHFCPFFSRFYIFLLHHHHQPPKTASPKKMPRNRSVGRAPAPSRAPTRPTVPASSPMPQQQRPAATMAAPPQHAPQQTAPAPAASQGPGLFGQMASTAAGVAIGSSVGHAIGGLFSGGSSEPAPQPVQAQANQQQQQQQWGNNCQAATQQFTKCMDDNGGNMQICNWYLEQLKACQAAASQY